MRKHKRIRKHLMSIVFAAATGACFSPMANADSSFSRGHGDSTLFPVQTKRRAQTDIPSESTTPEGLRAQSMPLMLGETGARRTPVALVPTRLRKRLVALERRSESKRALTLAHTLSIHYPNDPWLWNNYAYLLRGHGHRAQALLAYERLKALQPGNKQAERGIVFRLDALGAATYANHIAQGNPATFTPREHVRLQSDAAALKLRYANAADETRASEFRWTNAALDQINAQLVAARRLGKARAVETHRLLADKVIALAERKDWHTVARLYEHLVSNKIPVPWYSELLAARAYESLNEPAKAKFIFSAVLAEPPGDYRAGPEFLLGCSGMRKAACAKYDALAGRFFACSDLGEDACAKASVDELVKVTPLWTNARSGVRTPNYHYAQALGYQAMDRAYSGHYARARVLLKKDLHDAPNKLGFHTKLGYVDLWDDLPRHAAKEFTWSLNEDNTITSAYVGKFSSLSAIGNWEAAAKTLARVPKKSRSEQDVRDARDQLNAWNDPRFTLRVNHDTGTGASIPNQALTVDAKLYSRPFTERYRIYAHAYSMRARVPQNTVLRREGMGLDYTGNSVHADVELDSAQPTGKASLLLSGRYGFNDNWSVSGVANSSTNDISELAVHAGVTAAKVGGMLAWAPSSATWAGLSVSAYRFSDGNRRLNLGLSFARVLITGIRYVLGGSVGVSAETNTLANAPYFNPKSSRSLNTSLYYVWRRDWVANRSVSQRITFSPGMFAEQGYRTLPYVAVSYQASYRTSAVENLGGGISYSRHPYDGQQNNDATLWLFWKKYF